MAATLQLFANSEVQENPKDIKTRRYAPQELLEYTEAELDEIVQARGLDCSDCNVHDDFIRVIIDNQPLSQPGEGRRLSQDEAMEVRCDSSFCMHT